MNTELNKLVQRQVFKMLKAKEAYDLALSECKLKDPLYANFPYFKGLKIQEAIDALELFKQDLPDGCEIDPITSDWDEGDCVKYHTYESDEDYQLRLLQLQQVLESERKDLFALERTKEFYESELNNLLTIT